MAVNPQDSPQIRAFDSANWEEIKPGSLPKRKRVSRTCTNCKSRKIKCDRGVPCSQCKKYNVPDHLCIYKESPFIPTVKSAADNEDAMLLLMKENERLKKELETMKLNLSGSRSPDQIFLTPPTIAPEFKTRYLKRWDTINIKTDRTVFFGPTSWRTILEKRTKHQNLTEKLLRHISNCRRDWRIKMNMMNISPEDYADADTPFPQELLRNLGDYLPEYDIVKEYIDLYISSFWEYSLPVVDTAVLIHDFQTLFSRDATTGKCSVRVKNKWIDYAKIALVVMVFKAVLLMLNRSLQNGFYDEKDKLGVFVRRLLQFAKCDIKATLPALQTLILMYHMKKINPLDGDGGDSSKGSQLFKRAVNMAVAMGLHQDIDKIYKSQTASERGLMKEIWCTLYIYDSRLSFDTGLPLTVDDDYIHHSKFPEYPVLAIRLARYQRALVKLFSKPTPPEPSMLYALIYSIEKNEGPSLLKLSEVINDLKKTDDIVEAYPTIMDIMTKINFLFTLQVMWESLADGLDLDDPQKLVSYTASTKYSVLCLTHFIELLYIFNKLCCAAANENRPKKLYRLIDIVTSFIGVSNVFFIRAYVSLFSNDLNETTFLKNTKLPASIDLKKAVRLQVQSLESVDPTNDSSLIVQFLRTPAFVQGLMALACKHLIQLQNQSYARVFNFSYCLYGMVSCYKFYDSCVGNQTSKEKFAQRKQIRTLMRYTCEEDEQTDAQVSTSFLKQPQPPQSSMRNSVQPQVPRVNNIVNLMARDADQPQSSTAPTPSSYTAGPPTPQLTFSSGDAHTPSTSDGSPSTTIYDTSELDFDFFEFNDEAVNRLFDNLMSDDQMLLNFDNPQGSSWMAGIS
ncbi:CYFA0S16e00980g1_1 [Cyberlindnera fabianii]|uniref:CYFA0S16e00980g1_1 n=1 Tax=Cyberlindnera fabianii TaxID=36022 RepID=A0A061B672_CYBFA|nr:CYFA0S16e00980g1_1 [Cyberlindnera fabianii]